MVNSNRHPQKPKMSYPGVRADQRNGRWAFRALVKKHGKQFTGPLRETQRRAYEDLPAVRVRSEEFFNGGPKALGPALQAVIRAAEERGLEPHVVLGVWENPARRVLTFWSSDSQLERIGVDEVCWMIDRALEGGYSGLTIRKGYLKVLHAAFELAGLKSPVPEARIKKRAALRHIPKLMCYLTTEEVADVLDRMETYKKTAPLVHRDRDIATVLVFTFTGVRAWELARVERRDVNFERRTMAVRRAKDKEHPRVYRLPTPAVEALELLCRGLDSHEPVIRGGHRALNKMFERWKYRLKEPRLNGRSLRHSFATALAGKGLREFELNDLLGHARGSKNTARYVHAAEEHLRAAPEALAAEVGLARRRAALRREGLSQDESSDQPPSEGARAG